MVITKSMRGSAVKITTVEFGNGWTVEVEVDNRIVHHQDSAIFITEQEALSAGDAFAEAAVKPLQ